MAAFEAETTPVLIVNGAMISRREKTKQNPFRLKTSRFVKKSVNKSWVE